MEELFLGDTDWDGNHSPAGWELHAYDLDGVASTADSTNHCQPGASADPAAVKPDGPEGVDNGWGKGMMPLLTSVTEDFTSHPDETCNGISIGIGFKAKPAQLGSVAIPDSLPPNPC